MDRTFHHRITLGTVSGIILLLALSVYCFWNKDIILGLVMVLCLVMITERSLHTVYTFHDDKLTIYSGRLSKSKDIPIGSIRSCRPMNTLFGLIHYLLISYGDDNNMVVSVQPDNEQAFVSYLRKKMLREEKEDET